MKRISKLLAILLLGIQGTVLAQFPAGLPRMPQGGGGFGGGGRSGGQGGGTAVIDDSTKLIYGPRTTRYFYESDVLNNRKTLFTLDTLLEGIHRYNFVSRSDNQLTDLGNLGTALRPVFYETPAIGIQTGFSAFLPYMYQPSEIRYFDTRSPFTNMYYVAGGRGQNMLRFEFTQNITPRWNAGFNVQRFTSDVQFGQNLTGGGNNQRLAENWGFVLHSNYRSKNEKYTILGHYNNLNHRTGEQGGLIDEDARNYVYDGRPLLLASSSREIRNDLHISQQFVPAPGFQAYHQLDLRSLRYRYTDDTLRYLLRSNIFYRPLPSEVPFDSSSIQQDMRYVLLDNQFGLKGTFSTTWLGGRPSAFNYRVWYRPRLYRMNGNYNRNRFDDQLARYRQQRVENFVGGWLGYYFPDSLSRLTAEAEYLIGGDFRLSGRFETKLLTAGYESVFASPTLIQDRFISTIYRWNNNFRLRGTQHAYGQVNLKLAAFTLRPSIDYFLLNNYIYFDQTAHPRQFNGAFSVLRTGVGLELRQRNFTLLGQGYYTAVSRSELLRIPPLTANLRVSYDFVYAKKLFLQTGLELHYRAAYFGDAYMPLIQQFHLQNDFELPQYLLADAFVNARINRVRLFVKMANAGQGFIGQGYFPTPNYLGMRRTLAFGVHWLLFD